MNVEEARKVMWVKSNYRPLGELLDEGYLTKERLEWAARWAYNFKLKEAAKVLLESMDGSGFQAEDKRNVSDLQIQDVGVEVGISLNKAHSTIWPFHPYKGQAIGELVESKQLTLRDLGYAVENAWDETVRKAATVFLLLRLDQVVKEPIPSAGFVHIVSGGRSFAKRREGFYTLLQGMLFGFLIAFSIYFLFPALRGIKNTNPDAASLSEFITRPYGVVSLIVGIAFFVLIGWFINFVTDRINRKLEQEIDAHRLGQEGEDNVVQMIVQALDGNWHLFRNITLPGQNKADLDLVLVGPSGVWALEVKNYRGIYRNRGETWEFLSKKKWRPALKSPSRQANNGSMRLHNFLKADRLNVFVNPVVVWASMTSSLEVENPTVAIWHYDRLADELGNIWQGEKLSEAERNEVIEKLTRLCADQKRKTQ